MWSYISFPFHNGRRFRGCGVHNSADTPFFVLSGILLTDVGFFCLGEGGLISCNGLIFPHSYILFLRLCACQVLGGLFVLMVMYGYLRMGVGILLEGIIGVGRLILGATSYLAFFASF